MNHSTIMGSLGLLVLGLGGGSCQAAATETVRGDYLVDSQAAGKTPKFLGVCVEVTDYQDRNNLWDWLADSGAGMARLIHPDKDMRLVPASESSYKGIATRGGVDAFRQRLLADPERPVPWKNSAFDRVVPWLGVADGSIRTASSAGRWATGRPKR